TDFRLTVQLSASEAFTAIATASRFKTGRAPGSPRQTGQVFELGGAPNLVEQPQKILVWVRSWTCTSRPITGSYFWRSASMLSVAVLVVDTRTARFCAKLNPSIGDYGS